jgi:hypothetical protein
MADHTVPTKATRDEEAAEAKKGAGADREATPEEAAIAEGEVLDPDVAAHEREMAQRGAHQKGEGRLP